MASFQRVVFKTIDVLFNFTQNYHKFKNIHVEKDIVYDPEYPDVCALDIYRHTDKLRVKLPAVINVHGGGFMGGGREYRSGIARYFVDKLDIAVINISYHLCEEHPFPQFLRDTVKALEWVVRHAEEYDIDANNLYIMGDSAGAQIAAHAITVTQNQKLADALGCVKPDIKFKAALLYCGPYDALKALTNKDVPFDFAQYVGNKVLGFNTRRPGAIDEYEYKEYMNVLEWIQPSFPPAFICDTIGDVFCLGQGQMMIDTLKKNGVPYVHYYSAKKADFHCWYLNLKLHSSKTVLKATVAYMQSMLSGVIPPCERIVYGKEKKPKEKKGAAPAAIEAPAEQKQSSEEETKA